MRHRGPNRSVGLYSPKMKKKKKARPVCPKLHHHPLSGEGLVGWVGRREEGFAEGPQTETRASAFTINPYQTAGKGRGAPMRDVLIFCRRRGRVVRFVIVICLCRTSITRGFFVKKHLPGRPQANGLRSARIHRLAPPATS